MAANHDRLTVKAVMAKIPLIGTFEISPLCNFKCKMCYVRQSGAEVSAGGGLKPLSFWMDQVTQACDAGCLFPLLTGGEPFLYPHLRELYTAMHRMGMQVSINSNGSCIDEETVDWLQAVPPVRINITLYGAGRESYGHVCGDPDAFDRVIRAADLLQEAGILFRFNCSLTPDNANDLDGMIDIAARYGQSLRLSTYMVRPSRRSGCDESGTWRLSPEQAACYEVRANLKQLAPERFRAMAANACRYREPTPEQLEQAEAGEPGGMRCLSGRCSFWVDWQGNLSGCGIHDYPKYSLSEHSFAEAWGRIVDYTENFHYSPACTNCINRRLCFSCPAMVFNETGSFDGRPTYICDKVKYEAQWYRHFLEQMPQSVELLPVEEPAGAFPSECPLDEF